MDLFNLREAPSIFFTLSFATPVVLGLILSLFFGLQSRRKESHYFAGMLLFVVFWVLGNGISLLSKSEDSVRQIDSLFTLTSSYIPPLYLLFARSLAGKKSSLRLHLVVFGIAIANHAILITNYSQFLKVTIIEDGLNSFEIVYPMGLLFTAYYVVFFAYGSVELYRAYRSSSAPKRNKLKIGVASLIIATSTAALTNTIGLGLATIQSAAASAIITLLAILGLSYSVLKLEFLDVKPKIVRFTAYLIVFGAFSCFYLAAGLLISRSLEGSVGPLLTQGLYFIVALVLAVSYSTVKQFFNKVTDKIFYQDAYDENKITQAINAILLNETEPDPLIHKAINILESAIKPESLLFASINNLQKYPGLKNNKKTYVFNDESITPRLKAVFDNSSIVMAKRLYANNNTVGYLLFGHKKSGRQYSETDLSMISNASSSLAVAMQNAKNFEEIKQFSEKLKTEVAKATQKLDAANKELLSLDKAKDEFFSMASHQLKSPLTATSQAIYLLQQPAIQKDPAAQKEIMQIAEESAKRSTVLVRDMFSIAQLTTGTITLKKTQSNIIELVQMRVKIAQVLADQKKQTIQFVAPKDVVIATIDEDKIKEVISNYLENAIKYSPEKSTITVALTHNTKSVVITVADNGIGIPKKEQAKLFTKFYRASNAISSREGTGLGLYLAKHIIELHGGSVTLKSIEGTGSTFGISLPKS